MIRTAAWSALYRRLAWIDWVAVAKAYRVPMPVISYEGLP